LRRQAEVPSSQVFSPCLSWTLGSSEALVGVLLFLVDFFPLYGTRSALSFPGNLLIFCWPFAGLSFSAPLKGFPTRTGYCIPKRSHVLVLEDHGRVMARPIVCISFAFFLPLTGLSLPDLDGQMFSPPLNVMLAVVVRGLPFLVGSEGSAVVCCHMVDFRPVPFCFFAKKLYLCIGLRPSQFPPLVRCLVPPGKRP